MAEKKNILTYEGLKKLEDELQDLKVNQRREIAQKIKEAREQGDLSENAEYDAAKDEQRDIRLVLSRSRRSSRMQRLFWMRRSILTRSVLAVWYVYWT